MTKDELIAGLSKHKDVVATSAPDTFLRRDESTKNLHGFYRAVSDNVVLWTTVLNATNTQATATGLAILDFAQAHLSKITGRITTKLGGLNSGYSQFDHLIALGPGSTESPPLSDARFHLPVAVRCGAINECEFIGDEEVVELRARVHFISLPDMGRAVLPAANERHRFDNGVKSKQKFLGVARQKDLVHHIEKLPKLGGVVEMENYQRVGCVFLGKAGEDIIEVTLEGKARKVPLAQSLKFLDTLLHRGVEASRKEL